MPSSHHRRHHIDARPLDGKGAKGELDNTQEVMKLIQEAVKNDPTKELSSVFKDKMKNILWRYFNSCLVTEPIQASFIIQYSVSVI